MEPKEKTIHLLRNDSCETCFVATEIQHSFIGRFMTAELLQTIQKHLESIGCKCKVGQSSAPLYANSSDILLNVPEEWICENYKKIENKY